MPIFPGKQRERNIFQGGDRHMHRFYTPQILHAVKVTFDFFRHFSMCHFGATAIEFGLIASLISIAIITAAGKVGTNVSGTFSNVAANMTTK